MRIDQMTIDDLDQLLTQLDGVSEAGKLLVSVGLTPVFSLMPGRPLVSVPPLVGSVEALPMAGKYDVDARLEQHDEAIAEVWAYVFRLKHDVCNAELATEDLHERLERLEARQRPVLGGPRERLPKISDLQPSVGAATSAEAAAAEDERALAAAPPAGPAAGDDIAEPSTEVCHTTEGEAEAVDAMPGSAASTPAAPAVSDEADNAGDPLPEPQEPSTEPANLLPADQVDAAEAPQLQVAAQVEAPAVAPMAAGAGDDGPAGPAARWDELSVSAAIQIYVDTMMLGGKAVTAYELIGTKFGRTSEAVRKRFMTAWKSRAHQALEAAKAAEARTNPAQSPDYVSPLVQHLATLPHPKGWSYRADLDLVMMILDRVDQATIAANLEVSPVFVKSRWDVLTGQYKDTNDKLCRRWVGVEIRDSLQHLIADQVKRPAAAE